MKRNPARSITRLSLVLCALAGASLIGCSPTAPGASWIPGPAGLTATGAARDAGKDASTRGPASSRQTNGSEPRVEATQPPCLEPGEPTADAYDAATGPVSGQIILPNGRALTPAGTQVRLTGLFPTNVILSHSGRYAFASNGLGSKSIQQIDLTTQKVVATLGIKSVFQGMALTKDDKRLYVADGDTQAVYAVDVGAPGLALAATWSLSGYPASLALSPDGNRLLVSAQLNKQVLELDPVDGTLRRSMATDRMPYQIVFSADGKLAYVSQWAEKSVSVIDLSTGKVVAKMASGKNPSNLILSPAGDKLYVAATDQDEIDIFSTSTRKLLKTVAVGIFVEGMHGASPVALAFSPDGATLYVANAGDNAVEVYNTSDMAYKGAVPVGWFPSGLAVTPDGSKLIVSNAKGEGSGPNMSGASPESRMYGTVSVIPLPLSATQLTQGETQVLANNSRATALHQINCAGKSFPVPSAGGTTPIEHVVFLLRENKTYDAYLGDLEVGDGEPSMAIFGEEITPNTHQLAREFTVLDNFYTEVEDSDQGHMWSTTAICNDYKERTCHSERLTDTGVLPAADALTHYIFDHLERNGIDYVNYGEVVGLEKYTFKGIDKHYPGVVYNTSIPDQKKAEYVQSRIQDGFMPTFTFLSLPDDHTYGTQPGKPTPESMVSDNDYAVGLVVDAITKSEFWPTTAIFILEDDPQTGADHIDSHRSPAIVVSPWSKRGHVSSVIYSIPSVIRTMGLMIDLPPMTQYDAMATPMYDAFTATPDFTGYDVLPRNIPDGTNPLTAFGAAESMKMDFSGPDRAKGLGPLLWRYRTGTNPPVGMGVDDDD